MFQPIWIPIRDWNSKNLSWFSFLNRRFQPIWIPIRDWNGVAKMWLRNFADVSTNLNPYQGLKRINPAHCLPSGCFNQSESLSGIETILSTKWICVMWFQPIWIPIRDWNDLWHIKSIQLNCFNQSESLSGIETIHLLPAMPCAPVSTNLNPYQGLKQPNHITDERLMRFQPIWIPIRDWNSCLTLMSPIGFVSTNLNPYQGLKL